MRRHIRTEIETLHGPAEVRAMMTDAEVRALHAEARSRAIAAAGITAQEAEDLSTREIWNLARRAQAIAKAAEIMGVQESTLSELTDDEIRAQVATANESRAGELIPVFIEPSQAENKSGKPRVLMTPSEKVALRNEYTAERAALRGQQQQPRSGRERAGNP